ncbi:MAG TPA: membrane protein insertion efficiency factor YidD [Phycisphaerae bacterium]|nr:membrane protein insertion efficiency factor YidD [Phycisphaerae bacterium]HOJ75978.1 membrane protein insertion efficiency factor YidD [Phycisphaerae bacterium]HOM53395.1 membrane protein insertion efficiency factor YidD [Phycisphaerae bacterium]HON67329.1 membrane protein insertion efficiency factor YidD [Phycisphaerae bacterium]HOQ86852.1 membrane protein insertion efficiency factor YidD [Phycisphaerae bacterium]
MPCLWTILRTLPMLVIQVLIRGYQFIISPLLIGTCKFVPSCSDYFLQAVHEWGVIRGSWLGIRRLARCHPFGMGGIDPVPRRCDCSASGR